MFRERFDTDRTARTKNGRAAHKQTGVANASSSHARVPLPNRWLMGRSPIMSPMERINTGTVSANAHQNRFDMSSSSGFESASANRASSAMPHLGQSPGSSLSTPSHIGQ